MYQRRDIEVLYQDAILAGHMRDLLKSQTPIFDGSSSGIEEKMWILDSGRFFVMHPNRNNTKVRCSIILLSGFASTWWCLDEQKLDLDITSISWEMFLKRFNACFLSDHWRQRKAYEFYDL